jgi:RimJ/RimL family protein N-acetyltransferase
LKRTLLFGHDQTVADFVARLAPIERPVWHAGFRAIGILRGDGALVAGVVFNSNRQDFGAWEVSGVSVVSHPCSIEMANEIYRFAFQQLSNANRIEARTSVDNKRARRMLRNLGFVEEGVQADYFGPRNHAVMARLLKAEWERKRRIAEIRKAA